MPIFVGPLLLLGAARMLGQQSNQNTDKQAPAANGQSQTSSGQNQGSQQSSSQAQHSGSTGSASAPAQNSPASSNAFPMAQSEAAAKADAQKNQDNGKPTPSQANPFPEAQSKAAAKPDGGAGAARNSQAGSSSSVSGYSSSDAHLPDPEVGQGNLGSHEKLDSFTRDQTQDGRVQDDLNTADLYMDNGNYRGSYLRYEDALQYDPQNDTALYGLAEAMCKENLTSEAMAHFKSYATNNPQGKYARKAEKMLAHPEKCTHNR